MFNFHPIAHPLKMQYPGVYYHVVSLENRSEAIFINGSDGVQAAAIDEWQRDRHRNNTLRMCLLLSGRRSS